MKNILYYLSIILVISAIFYISGFLGLLKLSIFIIIYSAIFYGIYFIYKTLSQSLPKGREVVTDLGNKLSYKKYLIKFIKKGSFSFIIIGIIIGLFGYYQNYISPAKMTEFTISNGKKTVIFQEMSHIGSQKFYDTIKQNLINYKKKGFVYFFEGVKPGTKENMDNFNKAIGIKFNKDLYKTFSKLYGVTFQTTDMYLGLVNDKDFNVDVDIDWIMDEYKALSQSLPKGEKKIKESSPIDITPEIINTLAELNPKQLEVLKFINKAILSALIKSDKAQSLIQDNFANKKLFDIILNGRNKVLSEAILNSKYNKIYITYGKLHFPGVLKLLQEQDKNWKIISKKEINSMN